MNPISSIVLSGPFSLLPLSLALTLMMSSCLGSSPDLLDSGSNVRITGESSVEDCRYLGPVTARVGANFRSYADNVRYATNDVRNQAGVLGATDLVLSSPIKDNMSSIGIEGCNNCVALSGHAYRCDPNRPPRGVDRLPTSMGGERGECYPNGTCNAGLTCYSSICVRVQTPDAPASEHSRPPLSSDAIDAAARGFSLGTDESVRAALPTISDWRDRYVRLVMKTGKVVRDQVWMVRDFRLIMQDGRDYNLLDASAIELVD